MEQVQRIIGVDFGTSTSLIRVKRYQGNQPVGDSFHAASVTYGNGAGDSKAVTLVRINEDRTTTCGRYGEEETPGSTIHREFKMDLENPDPGKQALAKELTEEYFKYLYERYAHQSSDLGQVTDQEKTIISYPAKWKSETVEFMEQVAAEAGFPNVTSMDEPSAALYAVLCRKMDEIAQKGLIRQGQSGYILLIDMGAGTTDLAVCSYAIGEGHGQMVAAEQIKTAVVSTWPKDGSNLTFGGREVDRILENYVIDHLKDCGFAPDMAANLIKGKPNVKLWKEETVSNLLEQNQQVNTCSFVMPYTAIFGQSKPFPAFGRGQFQLMLSEKLDQFRELVTDCLDEAGMVEPQLWDKGVDLVILTGGHSSWYFTSGLLDGSIPGLMHPALEAVHRQKERVLRLTNPQETVALGMVYSHLPYQVKNPEPVRSKTSEPVQEQSKETDNHGMGRQVVGTLSNLPEKKEKAAVTLDNYLGRLNQQLLTKVTRNVNEEYLRKRLMIPADEKIYFAHDTTLAGSSKYGTIFTDKGIYSHSFFILGRTFTPWEAVAENELLWSNTDFYFPTQQGGMQVIANFLIGDKTLRAFMEELAQVLKRFAEDYVKTK